MGSCFTRNSSVRDFPTFLEVHANEDNFEELLVQQLKDDPNMISTLNIDLVPKLLSAKTLYQIYEIFLEYARQNNLTENETIELRRKNFEGESLQMLRAFLSCTTEVVETLIKISPTLNLDMLYSFCLLSARLTKETERIAKIFIYTVELYIKRNGLHQFLNCKHEERTRCLFSRFLSDVFVDWLQTKPEIKEFFIQQRDEINRSNDKLFTNFCQEREQKVIEESLELLRMEDQELGLVVLVLSVILQQTNLLEIKETSDMM